MKPFSGRTAWRRARAVDVIVIGAGHSGLAMSFNLDRLGIDHVVLERGEIANSWRHERWDSLRLLTPNWQATLPDYEYAGADPDGFMTMPEVIEFINGYASHIAAPVQTGTTVRKVRAVGELYRVDTDCGAWIARAVVIANGAFETPAIPPVADFLPESVTGLASKHYRNPEQLPSGGVLIVGASATGLQLANEIHRSGRPVTLAVGEHIRMPRSYRGRDIQWWMTQAGVLDQDYTEVDDIDRARRVPSPQLVGTTDHTTLDLNALQSIGVRLTGRLVGVRDGKAQFSGSLANHCAMADLKLNRLLGTFDEWAAEAGVASEVDPETRPDKTRIYERAPLTLNLENEDIRTVVWATGLTPDHSWLDVPVFDRRGRIQHQGGVVDAPGLYVMGLPFLRRRKSSYIHGAADDAAELALHLSGHLQGLALSA